MSKLPSVYVAQLEISKQEELRNLLLEEGFALHTPPYSLVAGKKKGISVTLYSSGKLVVQGKDMASFIEFSLEPKLLKTFSFGYENTLQAEHFTPHMGLDESGKGDFFGPLVVAAVYADHTQLEALTKLGVADSKKLSDKRILKMAPEIRKACPYEMMILAPQTYNRLYEQFKNLNTLLAWAHSKILEKLYAKTNCMVATVDQFAKEFVLKRFVDRISPNFDLTQVPRAESDPVVAAASIVAREGFLNSMSSLEKQFEQTLPKGASKQTVAAGKAFVEAHGKERLHEVCKMHFKTTDEL